MEILIVDTMIPQISHYRRLDELTAWGWSKRLDRYLYIHNERILEANTSDCDKLLQSIEEQVQ